MRMTFSLSRRLVFLTLCVLSAFPILKASEIEESVYWQQVGKAFNERSRVYMNALMQGTMPNDPKIQQAMGNLVTPDELHQRPLCLDIKAVQQLMIEEKNNIILVEENRFQEFEDAYKRHQENTPPFLGLPHDTPKNLRESFFQFQRYEIDNMQEVIKSHKDQKVHAYNASRFEGIFTQNYVDFFTKIMLNMKNLLKNQPQVDALIERIKKANSEETFKNKSISEFDMFDPPVIEPQLYFIRRTIQQLPYNYRDSKVLYPLIYYFTKYLPDYTNFGTAYRKKIETIELNYAKAFKLFEILRLNHERYLKLSQNQTQRLTSSQLKGLKKFMMENDKDYNAFVTTLPGILKREYDALEAPVDTYFNLVNNIQPGDISSGSLAPKKKSHQQMVQAIKLAQEMSKKGAEEKESAQRPAPSQNSTQAAFANRMRQEYATNEGAYFAWYWDSLKEFNTQKEARDTAAAALAKETALAERKASKNHSVDPAKSAPSSVSTASTSNATTSKEEVSPIELGSNHFKTYDLLMTDKNCECDLDDLRNVLEALGGHVDPHLEGSRAGAYLRHIDTGEAVNLVIHYHPKNGRNTLRPEHVKDIQAKLTKAGYTPDRVVRKVGSAYDNTVISSSSTASTALSNPTNDDDGE